AAVLTALVETEQLVGGDAEGESEAGKHVGIEPQLVALVLRDQGLDDADALGQADLSEALLLAQPREALSQRLVAELERWQLEGRFAWHPEGHCPTSSRGDPVAAL